MVMAINRKCSLCCLRTHKSKDGVLQPWGSIFVTVTGKLFHNNVYISYHVTKPRKTDFFKDRFHNLFRVLIRLTKCFGIRIQKLKSKLLEYIRKLLGLNNSELYVFNNVVSSQALYKFTVLQWKPYKYFHRICYFFCSWCFRFLFLLFQRTRNFQCSLNYSKALIHFDVIYIALTNLEIVDFLKHSSPITVNKEVEVLLTDSPNTYIVEFSSKISKDLLDRFHILYFPGIQEL